SAAWWPARLGWPSAVAATASNSSTSTFSPPPARLSTSWASPSLAAPSSPQESSARRTTNIAWRRLLAAAAGSRSGHNASIACSRCTLWPGLRARSLTRLRALRSRHRPSSTSPWRVLTVKPPRRLIRSSVSGPVGLSNCRSRYGPSPPTASAATPPSPGLRSGLSGTRSAMAREEHYVFGYGSLLTPAGDGIAEFVPRRLRGYRRIWNVAMDNSQAIPGYKQYLDPATGTPPHCFVVFLNIVPD